MLTPGQTVIFAIRGVLGIGGRELRGAGRGWRRREQALAFKPAAVMLVPPSLDEWLPQNHLSRFIADIVETHPYLKKSYASCAKSKGPPPQPTVDGPGLAAGIVPLGQVA